MKKLLVGILYVSLLFLAGCSSSYDASLGGGESYASGGLDYRSTSGESDEVSTTGYLTVQPGQLTASEWSDLYNYDFYKSLFESSQDSPTGIFGEYYSKGYVDTLNLIIVHVHHETVPIVGAKVELSSDGQEVIYCAITDVFGNAYLFPKTDQLDSISNIEVSFDNQSVSHDYTYSEEFNVLDFDIDSTNSHEDIIEIMFVIDTTGSMGDEIIYLKAEVDDVISEVSTLNPNAVIKLALLFYRDQGDAYVTRYFDFTTNINSQKTALGQQNATGGGDFPEAVATALDEAVNKNWSDSNSTKLIIHVLDAPPHDNQVSMSLYCNALKTASEKGIRIIPVASSGIDKYTEYLLRNEAMLTGGTYVFLTNHSGIGNDHIEATVGDVEVEYLNQLLVRLITEYHTGVELEIIPVYSNDGQ